MTYYRQQRILTTLNNWNRRVSPLTEDGKKDVKKALDELYHWVKEMYDRYDAIDKHDTLPPSAKSQIQQHPEQRLYDPSEDF